MSETDTKKAFVEISVLIKAGKYDEARRRLIYMGKHPKAVDWLERLDQIDPPFGDLDVPFPNLSRPDIATETRILQLEADLYARQRKEDGYRELSWLVLLLPACW